MQNADITKGGLLFCLSTTALFLTVCIIGCLFHEFWRDEAYTWLLISASHSFEHLAQNAGYIGYPKTWYYFIYILKQLYNNHNVMVIANVVFITAAIWIFLRSPSLGKWQKILFCFGFFPLYQYGIQCRIYGLMLFLLFAYCALRPRLYEKPILPGIILAILASLHTFSFMISAVIVFIEAQAYLRGSRPKINKWIWPVIILILASFAYTAYHAIPPENFPKAYYLSPHRLFVFKSFANGFLPNFGIFIRHPAVQTVAGLILWSASWFVFIKRPLGFVYYLLWTAALSFFVIFLYKGYRWQHGFYFIFFVTACWIGSAGHGHQPRLAKTIITILLAIQAAMGIYATAVDIKRPCASGEHAAQYIKENNLEDMNKVGLKVIRDSEFAPPRYRWDIDETQSTLVYLDNKKIYNPVSKEFEAYWIHYTNPTYFKKRFIGETLEQLRNISTNLKSDLLLIVIRPENYGLVRLPEELIKLEDFPSGMHYGESISLYLFKGTIKGSPISP